MTVLFIQCHTNENRSSKEATAAICQNTWNCWGCHGSSGAPANMRRVWPNASRSFSEYCAWFPFWMSLRIHASKNRSPRKIKTRLILRTTSMISTSSISEYLLVLLTDCWCRLWPQGWKSLKPRKCADQTNRYRSAWPSSYNVGSWYIYTLGGGFKYFLLSSLLGEMIQFD